MASALAMTAVARYVQTVHRAAQRCCPSGLARQRRRCRQSALLSGPRHSPRSHLLDTHPTHHVRSPLFLLLEHCPLHRWKSNSSRSKTERGRRRDGRSRSFLVSFLPSFWLGPVLGFPGRRAMRQPHPSRMGLVFLVIVGALPREQKTVWPLVFSQGTAEKTFYFSWLASVARAIVRIHTSHYGQGL